IYIVKKIIEILREKTGDKEINEKLITHVKDRPGHDRRYAIDPKKISTDLGWKPATIFDKGINETANWYLENNDWLKRVITGEYMDFYKKNYKAI
ncbi:MAG: GDP-mannose 4,6-dehydratase, partial [Candidatus Heimdallarchaeaceae archaeon]